MTNRYNNCDLAAQKVIERVGKTIVIGIPLGIGKPIGFVNALYRLAVADPSINLTIITGLTLSRPTLHNELEKRLVEPILDRILKDYEDPLYEKAREQQQLPPNINVIEFFLSPGKFLNNRYVQEHYINSIYTSVAHDTLYYSINVIAQQVAYSPTNPTQYSLSSNTDLFREITHALRDPTIPPRKIAVVAEVNLNMPYMYGDALIDADTFTDILDTGQYKALFALPNDEISIEDHLIGLYTSALVKDDGCLQIGIGKLSTAVASALIFKQKNNAAYQELFQQLALTEKFGETVAKKGSLTPFEKGLYASTEMMSDDYLHLYDEDILKKRVYDHVGLQTLLNSKKITEIISADIFDVLLKHNIISSVLTESDIEFLKKFGIMTSNVQLHEGILTLPSGEKISADLTVEKNKQSIVKTCLGKSLCTGKIMHAGFFMGSNDFYQQLRSLPSDVLQQIDMTSVARTNSLLWSPELLQLQRQQARLINSAMMVTLGGEIVSDGLKNLQEVSGVGGQFDFVNMAQSLKGAVSIITCRSTRKIKHKVVSNIVWNYPHATIPRFLRDVIVTEYGIADCRSKTDADTIQAILNITDSRFQSKLLDTAKKFGKIAPDYEIPALFQQNYPDKIRPIMRKLQAKGFCQPFPFGTELTEEETKIKDALLRLKNASAIQLALLICRSFFIDGRHYENYLVRMKLNSGSNIKDFFYKKLLLSALGQTLSHKKRLP